MARIGAISDRYQSYNVEMLEVTGGKFWRPYSPKLNALLKAKTPGGSSGSGGNTPAGMNPDLYAYRSPLDLTNARRRKLAAAHWAALFWRKLMGTTVLESGVP